MISKDTATDIALAHREIERAEELLKKITDALKSREQPDLRDAFGRPHGGLQLGVPSGPASHTLFNVPWNLCKPVIEAHIAHQCALIHALNAKAAIELNGSPSNQTGFVQMGDDE